jgi:tetratricopeptide (TPR) repeat protein
VKRISHFAILLTILIPGISVARQDPPASNDASASRAGQTTPPLTARDAALIRGDIQMARKDYEQAIAEYRLALDADPKGAVLLNKMGIAYQQLGQLDQAERSYKKAMKADKKFSSAVNNLGTLEYQRKRYGRSIKYYNEALKRDMQTATIYSNLGYSYYGNKQYPEAMDAFGKALALDPDVFTKKGGVGAVLQQRTVPDPGMFNFLLAKFYAKNGDAERAAHYLKLSRDFGYKDYRSVEKDPVFASVINDPRVQEVLQILPSYLDQAQKTVSN